MFGKIFSTQLSKPPRGTSQMFSKGNLLAAWQWGDSIIDEAGTPYHFAIHSPARGWRGYRWDAEYGAPLKILLTLSNTAWVYTHKRHLIRLRIEENGEATITAQVRGGEPFPFDADESGCLIQREGRILEYLRVSEDERCLSMKEIYVGKRPVWAYFLPDGAIAICDYHHIRVISPEGVLLYEENMPYCHNHSPFIIYHADKHLYYTDDPRKGWSRSDVLEVHRERVSTDDFTRLCRLFTRLNNECYIALGEDRYNVYLYRLSSESPARAEHVWAVTGNEWEYFTRYNGLICISSSSRILGHGDLGLDTGTRRFLFRYPPYGEYPETGSWANSVYQHP